jgi:hypothetical protein
MFPLLEIGLELKKLHYRFNPLGENSEKTHPISPHERNQAEDLQDLFGLGLPLSTATPHAWITLQTLISMKKAGVLQSPTFGRFSKGLSCIKKCSIGYSTFEEDVKEGERPDPVDNNSITALTILHSSCTSPVQADVVPFGRDGARFLSFLSTVLFKHFKGASPLRFRFAYPPL